MLRDQFVKKVSEGLAPFLFRKRSRDVTRHGIGSTRAYFSMDSGNLFLW